MKTSKPFEPELAFGTRAILDETKPAAEGCDTCDMPLVFGMQLASGEQFSLDLPTLLKCLAIAEAEHSVPPIDMDWWHTVRNTYKL